MGKSRSKPRKFSLFPKRGNAGNDEVEKVTHKVVKGDKVDEHTIEVSRERLETSAMAVFVEPKAESTPLAPPVLAEGVGTEEPPSSPVTMPPSTTRPQIIAHWSVSRLERWAGSRRRLVATVLAVVLMGLIVKERDNLSKFFNTYLLRRGVKATKLDPIIITGPAACPPEMALVKQDDVNVCIDKWEASIVEIGANGTEQPFSPYLSVEGHTVKAVSKPGVVPNAYISHDESLVACEQAGKRLCEPLEWMTACEGPNKTLYTYGADPDEDACNAHGRAPLGELFSASFKDFLYDSRVMNDPSLNALEGTVAKTGSYPRCTNGFGVFDMVGNLHEWTGEKTGAFRGGYYLDTHKNGEGCRYVTTAHSPSYHDYSTGFRCCKAPDQ